MKVKVNGCAGYGPDGTTLMAWGPGEIVDVDDTDEAAVAHYERFAEDGIAEILEPAAKKTKKADPPKADPAKADPPPPDSPAA